MGHFAQLKATVELEQEHDETREVVKQSDDNLEKSIDGEYILGDGWPWLTSSNPEEISQLEKKSSASSQQQKKILYNQDLIIESNTIPSSLDIKYRGTKTKSSKPEDKKAELSQVTSPSEDNSSAVPFSKDSKDITVESNAYQNV